MDKSPDAFRTISEVAEALQTPAHVLRFWETRFPQIKPVKRAGGRRYYRPADVALLGGIRHLLHNDGMTIRGVQKVLREQGVRHVAAMAPGGDVSVFDIEIDSDDDDLVTDLTASGQLPLELPAERQSEAGQNVVIEPLARRATLSPDMPTDIVQFRSLIVPPPVVPDKSESPVKLPEGFFEGFLLPTASRRPLLALESVPLTDDVPEAAHIWVEDTDTANTPSIEPLFPLQAAMRNLADLGPADSDSGQVVAELARDDAEPDLKAEAVSGTYSIAPDLMPSDPVPALSVTVEVSVGDTSPDFVAAQAGTVPPNLAGIAARLRALPRPVLPEHALRLTELQMRLGLLHAQMTEALRGRK